MGTNGVLEIPCLGRPFQLAMFYDCRRDCLIPDTTMLDSDILTNALVCRDQSGSRYKVFKGGSLPVKMEMMKAEGNFKLSVLTGLANISNYAASFFENILPKEQQGIARITLICEKTSKVEEVDTELLKSVPLKNGDEVNNATHFVSRLLYGSKDFFIFDREVKRYENYGYVMRDMQEFIESLPNLDEIPEMDKEEAEKLTCTMYGDTFLQESPISLGEAFMHLKKLRKHHESVVPIEACLLPLSAVDIEAARHVTETESGILSQVQEILENFADINGRVNGFTTNKAFSQFSSIQKKISKFHAMVSQYTSALKKDLSNLLLNVRSGDAEMKQITAMLEKTVATPFNEVYLSSWVDKTKRELNLLSMYLESFKDFKFAFEPDQLDSVVNSLDYDRVVCFSFMIDDFQDEQIQEMGTYLRTGKWNKKPLGQKSWFEIGESLKELKTQARTFSSLAKSSKSDSSTNFVVTNISSQGKDDKIAVIKMFQDGQEVEFKPETILLHTLTLSDSAESIRPKITTSKQNSSTQFDDTRCGGSYTDTDALSPARQLNLNLQETNQGVFARTNNERRNVRTKVKQIPSGPHESIRFIAYEAGSEDQSISSQKLAAHSAGYHSFAKDGFCRERHKDLTSIKNVSSDNQSSNAMRSIEDQSKDQEELPKLPALTLAQKMRHHCEEIALEKDEFVPVYKLSMDETLRLDKEMIVRKCLKDDQDCESMYTLKDRREKVLLVMGATGAGKSTLINGMINFIMGVQWKDDFRFKLITEKVTSQHESVTKEITAYTIHPLEGSNIPYTFTIIDTPGFGDTRGLNRDVSITNQVREFFSLKPPNGIDHLDGIGFVTQASQARLTPTQKYIFDSILSIFGKDVQNNFFMMCTFADGKSPHVLDLSSPRIQMH
ncbi:verrucotoxin subunit beta-like [Stylophora pistillata]|uniref:verrucotoxin subunit beta-like n=1 Tax=Stylophora pistillata TaxID=50429 RepID=UPI000C049EDD|nr:verrucotoxin subunit beta-like [Stylophora pistillata]